MTSGATVSRVGRLAVAVGFDDRTPALVSSARSFARQFGYDLLFIHVLDGPAYDTVSFELTGFAAALPLSDDGLMQLRRERQEQMHQLLSHVGEDVSAAGAVLYGSGAQTIIDEAKSAGCSAIMTASHTDSYHLLPAKFSMTLSLMQLAPMPVFVMSQDEPIDFCKRALKILISDDLQESGREAAKHAYQLAAAKRDSLVRHLHVHGDFREWCRDTLLEILEHVQPVRADSAPEAVWLQEYNDRLDQMAEQGRPFLTLAESLGVVVERDVRTGQVAEEVHAAVEEFDPDVIFFGRHKFWRMRPFILGRMPAKHMLGERRSVCMIPAEHEMYRQVSFP